jgi:hypothetical protein
MKKLIVFAVLIGGPIWWFWGRTLEPARVVQAQLEAISRGDYHKAYGYLSSEAKKRLSPSLFQELIDHNSVVRSNYTSEFLSRKIENDVATFSGTVRSFNSQKAAATYILIKEDDRWAIQEFRFGDPES